MHGLETHPACPTVAGEHCRVPVMGQHMGLNSVWNGRTAVGLPRTLLLQHLCPLLTVSMMKKERYKDLQVSLCLRMGLHRVFLPDYSTDSHTCTASLSLSGYSEQGRNRPLFCLWAQEPSCKL